MRAIAQDTLREVDFAGDLGQQVAVCLPNTSRSGAWNVVARLTEVAKGMDIRLTEFPEDGSTLAALLGGDAGKQGSATSRCDALATTACCSPRRCTSSV